MREAQAKEGGEYSLPNIGVSTVYLSCDVLPPQPRRHPRHSRDGKTECGAIDARPQCFVVEMGYVPGPAI